MTNTSKMTLDEYFAPVLAWLDAGGNHELGFNMNYYSETEVSIYEESVDYSGRHCGTVCCIAGALNQFNGLGIYTGDSIEDCYTVGETIGMEYDDIRDLFFMSNLPEGLNMDETTTPAEAAATIRHFHRGVKALKPTRRLLVRITETNTILPQNRPKAPSQGARST